VALALLVGAAATLLFVTVRFAAEGDPAALLAALLLYALWRWFRGVRR
jgi:hypothetical protein